MSAVESMRLALPICAGGKISGSGNSETSVCSRPTNCPDWAWAAKSAMSSSKLGAAPREAGQRRPSGKCSSLSMDRTKPAKIGRSKM
jgi:hypothetical protein